MDIAYRAHEPRDHRLRWRVPFLRQGECDRHDLALFVDYDDAIEFAKMCAMADPQSRRIVYSVWDMSPEAGGRSRLVDAVRTSGCEE